MLERTATVRSTIRADAVLAKIGGAKQDSLEKALKFCDKNAACYADALQWTDAEINEVKSILKRLYQKSGALQHLVNEPLRMSGMFQRYSSRPGEELLAQAWDDAARGINHMIDVYGKGGAPRYPKIDSVSYDVKSEMYGRLVSLVAAVTNDGSSSRELFFHPSLRFALLLMDANRRDEAGRLEPLQSGENKEAIRHIASIRWDRYPYSVIVVPGSGTESFQVRLSPIGKLRLILAVKRFREGKAPLILVSGGYVHPSQTPFSEAVEMKKSLMEDFKIPADAILTDPHARHTTTNLRNAARQIYRYGVPFDKKALITTDPSQSGYIESPVFTERCAKELGYQPHKLLGRTSPFDLEFLPQIESLHADTMDPLDP